MQVSLQVRPLAYAMNYSMSLSIAERLKTLRLCVCECGLTTNFDNSSVATRRIRNAQPSHIFIFMSQIFHMPLLLSYFQAAHCLRALIVLLCALSCSCLLFQHVGSFIEQLLAQVWAAAQANSCPNHEHPPSPPPRPQYNHNLCVSLCVCVRQKLKSKQLVDIFTVQWIFSC